MRTKLTRVRGVRVQKGPVVGKMYNILRVTITEAGARGCSSAIYRLVAESEVLISVNA